MSKTVSITADKRETLGSANARRTRRAGMVPAVVYGHGHEASAITINADDAEKVTAHNGLVEIVCSCGTKKLAIVKEVQRHPINPGILHIDFMEVTVDEVITSVVPVEGIGEAAGTKQGGQLEQVLMELEVSSHPADIPDVITVDVSGIELGAALHVKDLALPAGITAVSDGELVVFHVRAPKTTAEAAPAEAESAE